MIELPSRVELDDIDDERERGWPGFHPEDYCHKCGNRNTPSWWVDSDRFNAAFGPPDQHPYNGIVCPPCLVLAHEAATGLTASWRLVPDHFRPSPEPGWWLTT